ncbi:MAG: iron ABC transporter permease [Lentisphaerae bacterium]|nr:iron ABC transporter permease [Lentisphaerota bacterium]
MRNLLLNIVLPLGAVLILAVLGVRFGSVEILWHDWQNDPVLELRLIRVLAAWGVGSSLALGGMTFQAVLRNPLAEPFTLGVSGGASVGAAMAFVWGINLQYIYAVPVMALVFALLLLGMVLMIAGRKGRENLLLSGVIAGTAASSVLMYLVSTANSDELAGLTWWMLGDLQAVDTVFLYPAVVVLLGGILLLQYCGRELNVLALGDENAWSLGVNPRTSRILLIFTGSILAVQTVVLAGLIAFAGLIVPHLVRKFYGCDHRKIVLPMALWGGAFLMLCDLLSRVIAENGELPIGVLTAAVGGGMFIYVLNCRKGGRV